MVRRWLCAVRVQEGAPRGVGVSELHINCPPSVARNIENSFSVDVDRREVDATRLGGSDLLERLSVLCTSPGI
jgi:hypothetical protein